MCLPNRLIAGLEGCVGPSSLSFLCEGLELVVVGSQVFSAPVVRVTDESYLTLWLESFLIFRFRGGMSLGSGSKARA